MRRTLEALVGSGVVSTFAEGPEPIYSIGDDQHLTAAYYRNTIVHFFVNSAITELALLRAAEDDVADRQKECWGEAFRLRDLLKFEFFFAEKEEFAGEVRRELMLRDEGWETRLAAGVPGIEALVRRSRPFTAHRVLRPFLEAYRVVSDELERLVAGAVPEETDFFARCLARGKQYQLQRRIQSAESVSKVLFASALRLARNRGLLEPASPDVAERRRAFAVELREVIRRVDAIAALAASRHAGLIG